MSTGITLSLDVSKLLPAPVGTSVGIGLFRVSTAGTSVRDDTLTQANHASAFTTSGTYNCLVIRCTRTLAVTVTLADTTTRVMHPTSLMVLTEAYTSISVVYSDSGAASNDVATISIIQS